MKTAIDILKEEIAKHPKGNRTGLDGEDVMKVMFPSALKAMEAYHNQFTVSDKTMKTGTYYREVPVSERLPKENGKYFVIYKDGQETVKTEAEFSDGYWGWKAHFFNKSVTHWLEKVEFTEPDTGDIEKEWMKQVSIWGCNVPSAKDIFNWFKENGYLRKPISEDELVKVVQNIIFNFDIEALGTIGLCEQLAREILTLINR